MYKSLLFVFGFASSVCYAKTVKYHFDIHWIWCAPDGFARPVMGINGQWPIPTIEADLGDTVVVTAKNSLGNQTTSLHFHGMYQNGTTAHDGGVGVSQCPMYPGDSFTYTFIADPPGVTWYHAHDKGQYPDGLRGKMIVHDPKWEESLDLDEQIYFSLSDWYHTQQPYIVHKYLSPENRDGDLPSPDSFLFDDSRNAPTWNFEPGKRYLIRLVSLSALACGEFHIEGHTLTVVGVDGMHTHQHLTDKIIICAGQRYDILVVGKPSATRDFNWIANMNTNMLTHHIPPEDRRKIVGSVRYDHSRGRHFGKPSSGRHRNRPFGRGGQSRRVARSEVSWGDMIGRFGRRRFFRRPGGEKYGTGQENWVPNVILDDMELRPLGDHPLLTPVDLNIDLRTNQTYYEGIGTRVGAGVQPWVEPKVPTLYTAFSTGDHAFHHATYGAGVDPWIINHMEIVQIIMENPQPWPHPMHLHGHAFQVVAKGTGSWDGDESSLPSKPMMRDTVVIPREGFVVIRFIADNPGVWFFHCHIDMHLLAGMASTFIEAPDKIQVHQAIPDGAMHNCRTAGVMYSGNCAGAEGAISKGDAENCHTIFNVNVGEDGQYGAQLMGMKLM